MSTVTRGGLHVLATEAVLLRPKLATASVEELRLWPILVFALDERHARDPRARGLFALLNDRHGPVAFTAEHCRWSVRNHSDAVLGLAVRTRAPINVDVDVVLPVGPLLEQPDLVDAAKMVALTTRRHVGRLVPGVGLGDALKDLVLVGPVPFELASLAVTGGHRRLQLAN